MTHELQHGGPSSLGTCEHAFAHTQTLYTNTRGTKLFMIIVAFVSRENKRTAAYGPKINVEYMHALQALHITGEGSEAPKSPEGSDGE